MAKIGDLEVAEAVEAVSGLVEVTLLGNDDFTVSPDDLFDLKFNDNQVGIDDDRMPDFKANLKRLLKGEGIDDTIDRIPDNSNILISKVVEVVSLALALEGAHKNVDN